MSAQIKYAYLKQQTWLYRRNYPRDVAVVLGSAALKQSLKTADPRTAKVRAAEVNARFEATVEGVLSGGDVTSVDPALWVTPLDALRATLEHSGPVTFQRSRPRPRTKVSEVGQRYLNCRSNELLPSGFKSVRYSVGLFVSCYGDRALVDLGREDGREFQSLVARLSPKLGRSATTRKLGLVQLVQWSSTSSSRITARTQKRIWSQVNHFLDWVIYQGDLEQNPFRTVPFDQKVRPQPYAVPTDEEVCQLLASQDPRLHSVLLVCLLTGMRAGEATGLLRADLVAKGNLGWFVHVRPNSQRLLKIDAAERLVPVHSRLDETLRRLPSEGPLFPDLSVADVTKGFARLRCRLELERPGLVFHSTRKWFITQCERTGVPEHWTATLVGHKSARSENGITYGIYSAGISDEQKRSIIDQIKLPPGTAAS